MAEDLKITLETKLNQAREDVKAIQGAGGLTGPSGAKTLNKIQALFDELGRKDISKLDSDGLKQWLNTFSKLNHYIQTAGRDLSTYSAEYIKQQQKVEDATKKLSDAQDNETKALKKQEEAIKKYAESRATYYNKVTGKQVKAPDTVSSLYEKGQLEIRDHTGKTPLHDAALKGAEANLDKMVAANNEVQVAQQEVKAAEVTLKAEKTTLEGMPSGGSTHPITTQVDTHTAENYDLVKNTKEGINAAQSKENQNLSDAVGANVNALNKQSTSLGKAFKQFSIYAIGVRMARRALREAVKTIKDLDKYLTEQAMVTGKTRKQTYALLKDYQQMASDLGATTKEVAQVSTQFMRQGKTTKDALTLTRAAISAAKVAGISTAESVDYLTTAVNGFRLSANDAMKVSDKFAALAASAAVSYEEVATALSKVAAQANLAGMSIDFTTALLTKGIETTREPAESIGTALKTIIARMREITDYGKTLEDGMDLNNVETQLAYVDIKLRDVNGELRSTEDVLNELGGKWDTLSQNQQAAVAKALAGTRQQSRLIAMMQDYDRVIELQQIAQRSAGATSAQAAVYMEGMEAALNKINVAWEKIVSSVTNSEAIINILDVISTMLNNIGEFLSKDYNLVPTLIIAASLGLSILGNKMKEMKVAKEVQKIQAQQALAQTRANIAAQKTLILEKKQSIEEKEQLIAKAREVLLDKTATAEQKKLAQESITRYEGEIAQEKQEIVLEEQKLAVLEEQEKMQQSQSNTITKLTSGWANLITPLIMVWTLYKSIATAINGVILKKKAEELQTKKNTAANTSEAGTAMAGSAGKIPYVGWIIAAGILVAMGIAAGAAIASLTSKMNNTGANKAANEVNELSHEIYKLTEKANAIKSITNQYDALDNKIIKTIEDQKKMNELLDSAGDKLSSEREKDGKGREKEGTSEQDIYNSLTTDEQKREYLAAKEKEARDQANGKRNEQIQKLNNLDTDELNKILASNTTNASYLEAQSAIYAINNNTLYEYIDSLEHVGQGVESFTQNILENLSAQEAWAYASGDSGEAIQQLVDTINNATTIIGENTVSYAEILESDDYSFKQKINAYDELSKKIEALGDPALTNAFKEAYQQWFQLSKKFSETAIDYIDSIGLSIDAINDFSAAIQKLGYTSDESAEKISSLFDSIADGEQLSSAILTEFGDVLNQFDRSTKDGAEKWKAAYNTLLNGFQKATGVTLTNIGQNMTSLQSRISKFYEMASKWNTLSESEKTEFMQDNDAMFRGEGGEALARAFESGNYNEIQKALANNNGLKESIRLELQELEIALQIAEARKEAGEENEFEIKYLKEQIALLEDYQNAEAEIYRADLKLRLEQEKSQLDLYKDYLEKQKEALQESLDKRKSAYEKYFDAVNQEEEDAEYDKQAETLTANLSKLASSTNGAARQQTKELEKQFEKLEEERLKTLRERAQEAVLSSLDSEVSEINNKFDELLEDQAKLLAAMNKEIAADPNAFVQNMLTSGIEGMTATQAEDYIKNNFATAFDSVLPAGATEGIKVDTKEDGTLILNVNGTEIPIGEAAQQDLYLVIMNALKQMGLK